MPDELPDSRDPLDDAARRTTPAPEPRRRPDEPRLGQRQKAWLGMGAVLVALVLLTLLPDRRSIPTRRRRRRMRRPRREPAWTPDSPRSAWTRRCTSR